MTLSISVDIGGTFTDLFAVEEISGKTFNAKSLTTYDDLSRGIFDCLQVAGLSVSEIGTLVHGSTIAINIALQRNGARTALVVTKGTRDVYEIARGNRVQPYDIFFRKSKPLVAREVIFEASERLLASGDVHISLDEEQAQNISHAIRESNVEAVAVCFLHSYASPKHEATMGEILRRNLPNAYVTLSHEIVREYREYERTSTTVLNAYIGPSCRNYLNQIEEALSKQSFSGHFLIMQSNGGVMTPSVARQCPVMMMESGPVGGVMASAFVGKKLGYPNLITFDMGGTTAKMSVINNGETTISPGYYIGKPGEGHPVMLPVVDIVEIGAGGGSIAWLDSVGALHVGPRSAGSSPGPICYATGGSEPTVTDANLILGRLNAANFLGGRMRLDETKARAGIKKSLSALKLTEVELASGIVNLAIASMVLALRGISVERGYDPRDFVLVAQGGNGPLHALQVARELGIRSVLIPPLPGVFSAVGMLLADLRHDYVRTHHQSVDAADFQAIAELFDNMRQEGEATLSREGVLQTDMAFETAMDLRYLKQEFTLPIPVSTRWIESQDRQSIRTAFDQMHELRFGRSGHTESVEIVNLRLVATGTRRYKPELRESMQGDGNAVGHREIYLHDLKNPTVCTVYDRRKLDRSSVIRGPAVIEEGSSTTLLWLGDMARMAEDGSLVIDVGGGEG